jgi:hypothetical protein
LQEQDQEEVPEYCQKDDECAKSLAEQDPYDLEVLRSIEQGDFRHFSEHFSGEGGAHLFAFVKIADAEGNQLFVQKTMIFLVFRTTN